jgi:hypothetical protein
VKTEKAAVGIGGLRPRGPRGESLGERRWA